MTSERLANYRYSKSFDEKASGISTSGMSLRSNPELQYDADWPEVLTEGMTSLDHTK